MSIFSQKQKTTVFEKFQIVFFEKIHSFENFFEKRLLDEFSKEYPPVLVFAKKDVFSKKFLYKNFEIVSPYVSLSKLIFQRLIPVVLMTEQQLGTR